MNVLARASLEESENVIQGLTEILRLGKQLLSHSGDPNHLWVESANENDGSGAEGCPW